MNKVEIAGVNTSNLPLLSPEEKDILMKKIKDGDEKAREEFIRGNLRLLLWKRRKSRRFISGGMYRSYKGN